MANNSNVKVTRKTMSIAAVKQDDNVNVREGNNYDIPAMMADILEKGRITDPISVRACDLMTLRGNRRVKAGQLLLADPNTPQDVADALKKVEVLVYDVVPGSDEELAIILDTGSVKGLARTEILKIVWKLYKQLKTEREIGVMMYRDLANYTGDTKKSAEAAAITDLSKREEFINGWFRGTLGSYMLSAAKMGDYVREQMVLTHLSDDRLLPADKKVEVVMSRKRIGELSKAKTADDPKNGGEGWTYEKGGKNFNAKIETFKEEDSGKIAKEKATRPTEKALREQADMFKSKALRAALLVAAGDQSQGKALVSADDVYARWEMVSDIIAAYAPKVNDPNVKALLVALIGTNEAASVEEALKPFVHATA